MKGPPATGPLPHFLPSLLGRFDKRRRSKGPKSRLLPQRNRYRTGSAGGLARESISYRPLTADCRLPIADCRLPIADCRLLTAHYYDTDMKKIIFLLLLAAVGVVAYKYFTEEGY